ncbi:MAG: hypothetical protein H6Q04_2973, partial [Acidobacteria bacterium]|nr:hypothetical protein [Acidobacteriota bacterium]
MLLLLIVIFKQDFLSLVDTGQMATYIT